MKIALLFLALPVYALGQITDNSRSRFLDVPTIAELSIVGTSLALDGLSTQQMLAWHRLREDNPIIPHSRIGTGVYFASAFSLDIAGTYFLRRHRWTHRIFNLALCVSEFYLAKSNFGRIRH
jgi:hypothetical protein